MSIRFVKRYIVSSVRYVKNKYMVKEKINVEENL
jgi:hypothetical protein